LHTPHGLSFCKCHMDCPSAYATWIVLQHMPHGSSFCIRHMDCPSAYPIWIVLLHTPHGSSYCSQACTNVIAPILGPSGCTHAQSCSQADAHKCTHAEIRLLHANTWCSEAAANNCAHAEVRLLHAHTCCSQADAHKCTHAEIRLLHAHTPAAAKLTHTNAYMLKTGCCTHTHLPQPS